MGVAVSHKNGCFEEGGRLHEESRVEKELVAHREGVDKGYFISSEASGLFMKPGFFRWWNSAPVVALDLTNPKAVAWFVHRLKALQAATGIDGFKFDAGLRPHPPCAALHSALNYHAGGLCVHDRRASYSSNCWA